MKDRFGIMKATGLFLVVLAMSVLSLGPITGVEAGSINDNRINVAVLDTGVDIAHKALSDKVIVSVNLTTSTTDKDINGHGTHIAGIIASTDKVNILNVKVAGDSGVVQAETAARGIKWAVDNGARVVNVSLTLREPDAVLEEAVNYAWDKGAVIVAAAGNNFSTTPMYPAAYSNVIGVAATDEAGKLARWSNRGDWVKTTAPGVNILSSLPNNAQGFKSGTSQAAAKISVEASNLIAQGKTNSEVFSILTVK